MLGLRVPRGGDAQRDRRVRVFLHIVSDGVLKCIFLLCARVCSTRAQAESTAAGEAPYPPQVLGQVLHHCGAMVWTCGHPSNRDNVEAAGESMVHVHVVQLHESAEVPAAFRDLQGVGPDSRVLRVAKGAACRQALARAGSVMARGARPQSAVARASGGGRARLEQPCSCRAGGAGRDASLSAAFAARRVDGLRLAGAGRERMRKGVQARGGGVGATLSKCGAEFMCRLGRCCATGLAAACAALAPLTVHGLTLSRAYAGCDWADFEGGVGRRRQAVGGW